MINESSKFPCSGCGCCCHRIDRAVENAGIEHLSEDDEMYFPYKWDNTGRCEMLTSENKCSVYDNRPLLCNVDLIFEQFDIPKDEFYRINIEACNMMMDEDNIPVEYRIKIKNHE